IAVVGTRSPLTEQEKIDAHKVLEDLIAKEYTIVSGLALGCDTLGHTYGLRTNTIAVLGTPLNKRYPKENKDLQDKIAQDHIVVSQYPIGIENFLYYKTEQPQNFSKRNQTTVALASQGVLVLKTGDKGGTQHAIKEARIQNKKLYTMRCNFNPDNTWTNNFTWKQYGIVYEAE
ncbi:MAG: DNA-processing protein DprA, partial [Candidatus Woesearchaeota archaeon]